MRCYKTNDKILMGLASGLWGFNGSHWERDFYDCHLDNIEPVEEKEAEAIIESQLQETLALYKKAKALAREAHKGQVDKAGNDYFESHILPVTRLCSGNDPRLRVVALLHDTLEDTNLTEEKLREEFPTEIVDAVVALDRKSVV